MKLKFTFFTLFFLFVLSFSVQAQDNNLDYKQQVGLTGLPIYYFSGGIQGVSIYGSIGWFTGDHAAIGFRPFYGKVSNMQSIGTNLYYRYHFNKNRTKVFFDANIGMGYLWYSGGFIDFDNLRQDPNGIMFNYALGPGVDVEIKNGLHFEFLIQYLRMRNITHPDNTSIGRTLIPSLGIQKFF